MPAPELQEFLAKIQGGDEGSVEAMLREMDPFLRRVIRLRLLDGRAPRGGHHGHSPFAAQEIQEIEDMHCAPNRKSQK